MRCAECKIDLQTQNSRRRFCSVKCRNKHTNRRYAARQKVWAVAKRASEAKQEHPEKFPCALCGLFYRKVMNHVRQVHRMNQREYKLLIDAPLSKGLITKEAKAHMREMAYEQKQDERLKIVGKATRYTKGDPKTKSSLNKGRKFFAFNPDKP